MNMPILTGIVDRFEEDIAVIELNTGKILNVPKFLLETDIEPGDSIYRGPPDDSGYHTHSQPIWKLDAAATKKRREQVQELVRDVMKQEEKKGKEQ